MNHVHLIANTKSGRGKGADLPRIAARVCAELDRTLISYEIKNVEAAVKAAEADGGVVVAAGGDGTIRAVAEAAVGRPVRFAVVAVGTFNFFARTHRLPEDPEEAFRLALTGDARRVRLGEVSGRVFLINASLGLYAKAISEREERTSRWGRRRIVAIVSTAVSFLSSHRVLRVELVGNGENRSVATPMIFIGNNALQLRDLKMDIARCMKLDLLAVVWLKPLAKLETLKILFRGITKTLEKDENLESFCVDSLVIHTRRAAHHVALDGEMFILNSPLVVKALPEALNMVLPSKDVET